MSLGPESCRYPFWCDPGFCVRKTHLSVCVHKVVLTDQVHLGEEELQMAALPHPAPGTLLWCDPGFCVRETHFSCPCTQNSSNSTMLPNWALFGLGDVVFIRLKVAKFFHQQYKKRWIYCWTLIGHNVMFYIYWGVQDLLKVSPESLCFV